MLDDKRAHIFLGKCGQRSAVPVCHILPPDLHVLCHDGLQGLVGGVEEANQGPDHQLCGVLHPATGHSTVLLHARHYFRAPQILARMAASPQFLCAGSDWQVAAV